MESLNVLFTAPGAVELRSEPVAPPKAGEVLCQALRSLVSIGTETQALRGVFEPGTMWAGWVRYPFHPGYSMVASVVEVGAGVEQIRPGDRVAVSGNHRQLFTSPATECYPLPEGISDEEGTWALLANTTQLGVRRAALQLGENVGVIGLGLLGQLVAQYCLVNGARRVIAVNRRPKRLEIARAHGATHVVQADARDAYDEVRRITGGAMLDVVFDVTSGAAALASATRLARRLGRVVLLADSPNPSQAQLGPNIVSNSLTILSVHGSMRSEPTSAYHPWGARAMTELFFDLLLQGRMRVRDLVTHRFSPHEAPSVYASLLEDTSQTLGVIFDWKRL